MTSSGLSHLRPSADGPSRIWRAANQLDAFSPFALALAFVLETYSGTHATLYELWRPLVVGQLLVAVCFGVLWAILRERHWAALITSIALGLIAGYAAPALVIAAVVAWWGIVNVLRRTNGRQRLSVGDLPTRFANVFSLALVAIALVATLSMLPPSITERAPLAVTEDASPGPNIYLLLLDGYPRSDTLADEFGIDNSAFVGDLHGRGFEVAQQSRSNYTKTWLTVASLLDGRYVHEIPELADYPDGAPKQIRLLQDAIEGSAIPEVLSQHGYQTTTIPSAVTTSDYMGGVVRDSGHLNALEIQMISHSALGRFLPQPTVDFLGRDQRSNVKDQLTLFGDIAAERPTSPRLVLAHLMSPHLPFLLGQEPDYLTSCFPGCDLWTTPLERLDMTEREFAKRLSVQIADLNGLVLDAVDKVIAADPNAIMIVMSDHGIRHHIDRPDEHLRNFFAARTPDYPRLFPDDVSPVNVFRRILSGVFDEHLPDLPYAAWQSDWTQPLILKPFIEDSTRR